MPHRSYASTANYRFGFNGKENDNEPKGLGNEVDYGSRIYDPRIGRFMSLDPLQKKYPNESNYSFVSNSPLLFKDEDGKDKIVTITVITHDGKSMSFKMTDYNYIKYFPGNSYGKLSEPYKSDLSINLVIDFSKSAPNELPQIAFSSNYINHRNVSYYEYSTISDLLSATSKFIFGSDAGQSEKIGFQFLASGDEKWNDGLPKAAFGSESINLKSWLGLVGGLSGTNSENEEKVLKMFSVILLGDKVEKMDGLAKAASVLDNVKKLHEIVANTIQKKEDDEINILKNNSNPSYIDPGKPSTHNPYYKLLPPKPGVRNDTTTSHYFPYNKRDTIYVQPYYDSKQKKSK